MMVSLCLVLENPSDFFFLLSVSCKCCRCSTSDMGTTGKWTSCCEDCGSWLSWLYPESQQERNRSATGKS